MNPIRQALLHGKPTFGCWFSVQCTGTAEKFGALGYDWVILDLQHGFASWENVTPLMQAMQLGGTPSLIRIHRHDPAEIGLALDLGAIGVIAPLVSTPAEARLIAEAMQYPPHGNRSFGINRASLGPKPLSYDPYCIVMIETAEGMKNLDAIVATPGVDCVLLGGFDLALSMGCAEGMGYSGANPPQIEAALGELADACRRHGKVAGNIAMDKSSAEDQIRRGIRFLPIGVAHLFMLDAAKRQLSEMQLLKHDTSNAK